MITLFHFTRLVFHNLRRGGQRALVALLCITFGVMALVAMTMLAKCIESAVIVTPAELLGGDMSMTRKSEDALRPQDVDQLNAFQRSGAISRYTLIAYNSASITFRAPGANELHFAGIGMGVEPDNYPLAGSLTIGEPQGSGEQALGLPVLLRQVGDTVITRDIAEVYNLKVGDPIVLADLRAGIPVEGRVRGIAYDTSNHQGDKIYFSIETAQKMANGQPVVNTVIANAERAENVTSALEGSGWSVDWAGGRGGGSTANAWVMGLRGAGILGLLVGGIGIANTMQVLLRRRQREIAIWKTLGFREGHLRLIFILEAGLLGLTGSLLGAVLGVLTSTGLLELLRRTSSLLYQWSFSLTPPLMGVVVGTLTTMIFAAWAIALSSQVRPMALLRNEPLEVQEAAGCQSALLGLFLTAPFAVLTSLVMESVWAGIGVLVCIVMGIAMLGGFFSVMLWICTHILPLRGFPLARMAVTSLRRRGFALVFAMMALFTGVLSLSMGLVVARVSALRSSGPVFDSGSGYNLTILAGADQESAVRQAIAGQRPEKVGVGYRTALADVKPAGGGEPVTETDAVLVGRSDPEDYVVSGAGWGSQPDGVYAYKRSNLKAGSQVVVTFRDGTTKILTVVGTYDINYSSMNLTPPSGLLTTAEGFAHAARPDSLTYFVQVAPDQANRALTALGTALPRATVINLAAYAARFMQGYQRLYIVPMMMAGLAFLAGLVLVANAVSLAMLDRRYEVGILKTVGYSRKQVLSIFAVEYGVIGLLATGAGVIAVEGLLVVMAFASHTAAVALLLNPPALALIGFCGVGLTLLTVLGVTWEPASVPPGVVLNER